jgi:hypothetical protein
MKKILTISLVCVFMTSFSQTPLPLLKVSANKRLFQTQDGKPFFWLGDTGWLLFIKLNREETLQYLDTRKAQGFNVIQVMVLHDVKRAVNKYGDSALINQNVATPLITPGNDFQDAAQYDFWDHIDFVIDEAARRGIYIALVPVWGSNVKSGWVSRSQARLYAAFLAERYKNKSNIIWINGGDINGSDSIDVWNEIGNTLSRIDTNHLISFHPRGRTTSSRWFHREAWLNFNMFQSGHRNYAQDTSKGETHYGEDNWRYVKEDFTKQPLKPTLDGEPSYEGIPQGLHDTTQPYWTYNDVRRYAYWGVLSGGAGFTYGNNAVMQFYQPGDKGSAYGAKKFWQEAMKDKGAFEMQYLKKLVLSKPYFDRVNDQSLLVDNGEKYDHLVAARGNNYAFIYTYAGNEVKVRMGKIKGKKIKASWFNPRTGGYEPAGIYENTGVKVFHSEGKKENGNDWVLVLESL